MESHLAGKTLAGVESVLPVSNCIKRLQEHVGGKGDMHKYTSRGHGMASRVVYMRGGIETKSTTGNRQVLERGKVRGAPPLFIDKQKGRKSNKSRFNL